MWGYSIPNIALSSTREGCISSKKMSLRPAAEGRPRRRGALHVIEVGLIGLQVGLGAGDLDPARAFGEVGELGFGGVESEASAPR